MPECKNHDAERACSNAAHAHLAVQEIRFFEIARMSRGQASLMPCHTRTVHVHVHTHVRIARRGPASTPGLRKRPLRRQCRRRTLAQRADGYIVVVSELVWYAEQEVVGRNVQLAVVLAPPALAARALDVGAVAAVLAGEGLAECLRCWLECVCGVAEEGGGLLGVSADLVQAAEGQ